MENSNYRKIIYSYMPSLMYINYTKFNEALERMGIAYVMNGGTYIGLYQTAIQYLKRLKRKEQETLVKFTIGETKCKQLSNVKWRKI